MSWLVHSMNNVRGCPSASLALVCVCADSCPAILQHWIQSTLYTHGICPLLPGLHLSDRTPNSKQAKHRSEAIASQHHSTLVAVHGLKKLSCFIRSQFPEAISYVGSIPATFKFRRRIHNKYPCNRAPRRNTLHTD